MAGLRAHDLTPAFGAEISGFAPQMPLDPQTCEVLQDLFDRRGLLVFRDLDIDHAYQVYLSKLLIRTDDTDDGTPIKDTFYISNKRPKSAAPFGRLQFHSDTMWADDPFEVLSLFAVEVEQPAVPTTFVSATRAWAALPDELRERVRHLDALHTAGEVRRGDVTDVLLSNVERPRSTTTAIGHRHPRTGDTILYVCEQMTKEIVGMNPDDSETLLQSLFGHLYDPAFAWHHEWRNADLVVWDNLAVQHGRPNVASAGPARTLRKVASPLPELAVDERPTYSNTG